MQGALKVGLLVVAFITAFVAAFAVLGKSMFAEPVDTYKAVFKDAGGVPVGSAVNLSGVRVGRVGSVALDGPGRALLILELKKGTPVPVGTQASIAGSLIGIGDRPIELKPPVTIGAMATPGSTLEGVSQSPLSSFAPESEETLKALNATLKATQGLLEDKATRDRLGTLLDSSNKTIAEFGTLAAQMNRLVAANQGQVQVALVRAVKMMGDLSVATKAIARIAGDGKLEGQMNGLLTEMNKTMKESNLLVADLRKTVNDPELQGPMKQILANTQTMTESGTKIASNAELMSKNGIAISEEAIKVMEKASKLADELSEVLKKFDKALGGVAGIASGGKGFPQVETDIIVTRESNPGRFRSDFEAAIPIGGDRYHLGIYDAFESNKLIAQIGRPLSERSEFRYGIYASKPGVGVSYQIAPGVSLRGDLFDVNRPRFDFRTKFDFNREVSGWLGLERIFDHPSPSIGIGIRR